MQVSRFQLSHSTEDLKEIGTPTPSIMKVLEKYAMAKIPAPGTQLEIQLDWTSEHLAFTRAQADDEANEFQQFGAAILFASIPKEMICRILSAIMVEKRIVFVSPNMRILSAVVLAFVPLLRPFIYQSVFLPVIPQSLQVVYTAPVPFVIGATTTPKESELFDELLVVDIPNRNFIIPPNATVPVIPGWKDLCSKIDAPLKKLTKSFTNHHNGIPYDPTPEESDLVSTVSMAFRDHVTNLFQHFRNHCITDVSDSTNPVSVFIKENFVLIEYEKSKEDQDFMREFLDTQLFFDFCDKQLRKRDDIKRI